MNTANLLKIAAVLGLVCGVLELYQAFTFVEDARRGPQNSARAFLIYIVPLGIFAGAALVYLGRIVVGAGIMLNAIAIQHTMIDMAGRHMVAVAIGFAGVALAMYVQRQFDIANPVVEDRVTVLPSG